MTIDQTKLVYTGLAPSTQLGIISKGQLSSKTPHRGDGGFTESVVQFNFSLCPVLLLSLISIPHSEQEAVP